MRTMGVYRGNPTLRVAIGSALRRRLYAGLTPHAGEPETAPEDMHSERWSRPFFDHLRDTVLPTMAPIEAVDDAVLSYFGRPSISMWGLRSEYSLVVAYDFHDSRDELRERARRWLACLRTRTAPGLASRHWGHPVYGARLDPRSDELDVVWAVPGDWMTVATADEPLTRTLDQPEHWSEAASVG